MAEGRAAIPLSNPRPGWFEQKAEDWTRALTVALRQLARKIDMSRVAALAISNQRESFAQFDRNDRPLRPGTLWLDERAPAEARDLANRIGAERIREVSGKPATSRPASRAAPGSQGTCPACGRKPP